MGSSLKHGVASCSDSKQAYEHVQATWTDLSNITRCQLATKELYESYFLKNGFSEPYFILSLPYMNHPPYERVTDEVTFFPDPETPRPLPWLEGAAITFGKLYDGGKPWSCCPRSFLAAQEQKLEALGIQLQVGFELEFYLLNLDGTPVDKLGYGEPMSFHGKIWKVISGAVSAMKELDIPVWKYHAEAGTGQFEVSIGIFRGSMVAAADALVLARQALFHTAREYGLNATFLPKPLVKGPGSSVHTHISLWTRNGENLFEAAPSKGSSFLAGIMQQMPSMMAIMCPNGNSYARHGPFGYSGSFNCIGKENRKAAIRVFQDGSIVKRFEVRTPDGTSNPYLEIASLIGAGIYGMENGVKLEPFVEVDPYLLPEEIRPPLLATSLAGAIKAFAASEFNREFYGEELFNLILLVRRGEEKYWTSGEDSMEEKMKILLEKY